MKFSILKLTKNEVELELDEKDSTMTELIAEKLNSMKAVDVAASKIEHPIVAKPKLFVRVKKGNPLDVVKEALDELEKEFKELKDEVK
ncbi:MAG: DNA-directed RNA polymerase subunit L [Bdellovibrio sp.]|nr:MAG: DNA-directed RNA polymerase subunit L [Bdellovibrio sp.]